MMETFPLGESPLVIDGPQGDLQAMATSPKQISDEPGEVTIVCHPHSLMGGTMNNKVVHTIARARRDMGHRVVRFNFRGVDRSQGEYADGIGEQEDLLAVMNWVRMARPHDRIWLAGFSFGSFVCAGTCDRAIAKGFPVADLLLVAPAVENYAFDQFHSFRCPVTMMYGDEDEVVNARQIEAWFKQVVSEKQSHCLVGAGHFFHGRLTELKALLQGKEVDGHA